MLQAVAPVLKFRDNIAIDNANRGTVTLATRACTGLDARWPRETGGGWLMLGHVCGSYLVTSTITVLYAH